MNATKVGLICLGEAGNFGDDLILVAAVRALLSADPECSVSFLSYGQELDWRQIAVQLGLKRVPVRVRARREVLWIRDNRRLFAHADIIVFGGGGLLQTSHQPNRIYDWLSYIPVGRPPVLAVGHGLGPINDHWLARLQRLGDPFSESWVRDRHSLSLSRDKLDWSARQCHDFVDREFVASLLPPNTTERAGPRVLGVALREWDHLYPHEIAEHIGRVAVMYGCGQIAFFVLEAKSGGGRDVEFAKRVAEVVDIPAVSMHTYHPDSLFEFLSAMRDVDVAISMKLHSCAVWSAYGVPMLPIYYAPKVASFFGREFRGLEISTVVVSPLGADEKIHSARDVVTSRLNEVRLGSAPALNRPFGASERIRFQLSRTYRSVARRLQFGADRAA